ncbi:MAG TPA: DAK2 domain-containing protein [Firmicutes bacterium]|nr:DAK2 domain-containing protein [Bacillota bacterium]
MDVLNGIEFKRIITAAAQVLAESKEQINALNVFPVPDGDTGTNMALTLQSALRELDNLETESISKVAQAIARGSLMGARGNSGVILSQYFRGFSDGLGKLKAANGRQLAKAFDQASKRTYKAVMKPVEGTMLTVGRVIAEACSAACENEELSPVEVWKVAVQAGTKALENTPNILPVLKQAGVVDAGGKGLLVALEGAYKALVGEIDVSDRPAPVQEQIQEGITRIEGVLVNKYCTEFLIKGERLDVDQIRSQLEPKGESLLVVGDQQVVKIHIHTDHPGQVLEYCTGIGDLTDIKIDNMQFQNEMITDEPEMQNHNGLSNSNNTIISRNSSTEKKPIGVVAVVPGNGLAEIFTSLGVDVALYGGQTMNPSTEELVRAVEDVNADAVIILPNNKNVIFSAQQVKEFIDKRVEVIATTTVPQGVAAMVGFAEHLDLEANLQAMEEEVANVRSGEITFAVRSTKAGELSIEEQDYIGLADGKIVAAGQSLTDVGLTLLDNLVDDDSSLISIYYGDDLDPEAAELFKQEVANRFGHCEVELYQGGQPLYFYIISVE